MLLNWDLRCALAPCPELSAATDLHDLKHNVDANLDNVEKLAEILEKHVSPMDTRFFQKVFEGCDVHLPLQDVPARVKRTVTELRSIALLKTGAVDQMREFCYSLNRTSLAMRWKALHARSAKRSFAA